jgi:hypothetical protein
VEKPQLKLQKCIPNSWKSLIDEATKHEAITSVNAISNQTEEKQE